MAQSLHEIGLNRFVRYSASGTAKPAWGDLERNHSSSEEVEEVALACLVFVVKVGSRQHLLIGLFEVVELLLLTRLEALVHFFEMIHVLLVVVRGVLSSDLLFPAHRPFRGRRFRVELSLVCVQVELPLHIISVAVLDKLAEQDYDANGLLPKRLHQFGTF